MEAIEVALGTSCSSRHHSIIHYPACEAGHCLGLRALGLASLGQQQIPTEEVDHYTCQRRLYFRPGSHYLLGRRNSGDVAPVGVRGSP